MKKAFFVTILLAFVCGCSTTPKNIVFQTSTIDALLAGVYDGNMSCGSLLKHGDFGIGTFDHLDGEMIVVDGEIYQVRSDGKVYMADLSLNTPFATVCNFDPDMAIDIKPGSDFKTVEALINTCAPNPNLFCAIKMAGHFKIMKTRSVPAQTKPYPPLSDVTKNQPEFEMADISGTIVGFRCPAFVKGINVPGYHLHFLSSDHTQGGHILSFETTSCSAQIDVLNNYFLTLPPDATAFAELDLSKDRSQELNSVEK